MQFFDLINFYRRFIKHCNKIVKFLIDILKEFTKQRKYKVDKHKHDERNKFKFREFDAFFRQTHIKHSRIYETFS